MSYTTYETSNPYLIGTSTNPETGEIDIVYGVDRLEVNPETGDQRIEYDTWVVEEAA